MRSLIPVFLSIILLVGCGTGEKLALRLNPAPTAETKRVVFPPLTDSEVPRFLYLGELLGEQNFIPPEGKKENPLVTALRWIVGLFESPEPVVLQRPQSGVVDEAGRILVTDVSRGGVYVFDDINGKLDVWDEADERTAFISPSGIAVGPEGRVFVADADLKRVVVLNHEGKGIGTIGAGQLARPTGLAWDSKAALLYVADTYGHQIKVFDLSGRLIRTIGERGDQPGQFNFPSHLALRQGSLYVSDTMNARVQVIPLDGHGEPSLVFGTRGERVGDLTIPKGVAVDSESNIYVVESYFDHLLVFDRQGQFLLPIGGSGTKTGNFYLPGGMWIDAHNRVFVADTFNGRVVIFQFLGGGVESD